MIIIYLLLNPPVTFRQGFECGFEPVDSNFRWDALLLFIRFCVFEIEILVIIMLLLFSFIFILVSIIIVIVMEVTFLRFQY